VHQIALAIRDAELFLLATVVRAAATDVYVNWPRDHVVGWEPHTSYHASGQHHQKSFGTAFDARKKQKPDPAFKGTVNLVSFGVATGEHTAVNVRCDPKDFIAVFEVPLVMVRSEMDRPYVPGDCASVRGSGVRPNNTFDRTAGSHSLAAAGQRGR
jgi:hypothetical protein